MKIAILHGDIAQDAAADELDVLVQVETVARVLANQGHQVITIPLSLNMTAARDRLGAAAPDLVFNLVESLAGTGRLIHVAPSLLDHLRIPYTGSATEAIFLTSNKLLAKQLLKAHGIATPPWVSFGDVRRQVGKTTGTPYIIKSVWEHASIGLDQNSIVDTADAFQLFEEMQWQAAKLGGSCFAESYIDGREFNLSLLAGEGGPEVLPPAEIRFALFPPERKRMVDYRAKWTTESFEYQHTPRCFEFSEQDSSLLQTLADLSLRCWQVFDLRGYARVDYRVDNEGKPWVLEVNANPCLAPDAGFYAACEKGGHSMEEVIDRIVKDVKLF